MKDLGLTFPTKFKHINYTFFSVVNNFGYLFYQFGQKHAELAPSLLSNLNENFNMSYFESYRSKFNNNNNEFEFYDLIYMSGLTS